MNSRKKVVVWLAACMVFFHAQDAWALYRQPTAVAIADWAMVAVLVFLALYVLAKVGFSSPVRFRISLALILLNAIVLAGSHAYAFYVRNTIKGWNALGPLGAVGAIQCVVWLISIPVSVSVICLLSKKAKWMTLNFLVALAVFCAVELGLNYREIDGYLATAENSNYRDVDGTAIRNYLSASGVSSLRLYPRERTKKVLLAELKSDSWVDRFEGATGLAYLRDPATIPDLADCLRIQDETDDSDQARFACAGTLQMLLGKYSIAVDNKIQEEHEKDRARLFERLEEEARVFRGKK